MATHEFNIAGQADAFRRLLTLGLGAQLLAVPALMAQDAKPAEMEKTIVTGSMIPTSESVAPIAMVDAEEITRAATPDVLTTLRRLDPSFMGSGNVGQTVNNGGGGEAYVAIRNLPTLVLLNGRRLANSAFSSGSAVDVNTLPLSMIERVEVLKDGSSVLYGSDAIGGVVNIITKKNFTGFEVGGRYGFTTASDNYAEKMAYVTGGTSGEKTSFMAGAQFYQSDPLLTADREVGSRNIPQILEDGLVPPTYVSPSFPGRVQSGGVSYILAGHPFAQGAPGYNPAITAPPSAKNPVVAGIPYVPGKYTSVPSYLAAHPGVYIPIASTPIGQTLDKAYGGTGSGAKGEAAAWPLLNTTQLGTYSIQTQDRRQAFANISHQLFDERMEVFGEFLYSNTTSSGQLAAAPLSSLGIANITISGDAPVNPFGIALGAQGAGSPRVRSRFIEVGNRIYENQNDAYHFVGGLRGKFENDVGYELGYNYNRNDQVQFLRNSPNGAVLQDVTRASSSGTGSAYSDALGPVPLFDPFALPGGNDPRTINALRATGINTGFSELWGVDGVIRGHTGAFKLPGGDFQWAAGGMFYTEALQVTYDGLTELGQLIGQNKNSSMPRNRRDATSGYVETRIPLASPDKHNLPGVYAFEITAAGRVESFQPGGSAAVPKVAAIWKPIDEQVAFRGGYSQSFLAPNIFQLYGAPVVSFDTINASGNGQVQMNWTSNPKLRPADAENWNVGGVFAPKFVKGLTLSVDYYKIKTQNDVYRVGAQAVADSLNAYGSASEFASTFQFDDGSRLSSTAPNQVTVANWGVGGRPLVNGASQGTDGIDFTATYDFTTETAGKFSFYGSANLLLSYQYSDPLIGGPYQYAGQFTGNGPSGGAQGTLPNFVVNTGMTWDFHNFTFSVVAQYIPPVEDLGDMHPSTGEPSNSYTLDGGTWTIDSFYTVDLRLGYELGKDRTEKRWYDGTRIAIGCRNITDNTSPSISSSSEDFTDKATYDIIGRFLYFELAKKF